MNIMTIGVWNILGTLLNTALVIAAAAAILWLLIKRRAKGWKCPSCGKKIQPHYQICPYCGVNLMRKEENEK